MTGAEKTAFQLFMTEALEKRAALIHEQRCIEEAAKVLRDAPRLVAKCTSDADKVDTLFSLIDMAVTALFQRQE